MSKWIEENNDHILEGHGAKFVVGRVLYSKQLPSKWTIKQSPFLLDAHKKFATLGEAKEYCEQRYQELFGKLDEITRLRADLAAVTAERDALLARLAPEDDEALVEIAVRTIHKEAEKGPIFGGNLIPAVIAAIRPHIEAAEREKLRENINSRFSPKSAQQIRDETDRLIEKHRESVSDWLEAGSWKQSGAGNDFDLG